MFSYWVFSFSMTVFHKYTVLINMVFKGVKAENQYNDYGYM